MQQINLYQDEFKRIDPPFSAAVLLIVVGYCLVISVIITVVLAIMLNLSSRELKQNKRLLTEVIAELEVARAQYPAAQVDSRLLNKIDLLKTRKEKKKKVLKYLSTRNIDIENQSFSAMLDGLTKVQQRNLWLTQVDFTNGGTDIKLTGRTLSAELLPEYLKKLAEIPAFSQMEFKVFDIHRNDKFLQFVVSSKRDNSDIKELLEKVSQSH